MVDFGNTGRHLVHCKHIWGDVDFTSEASLISKIQFTDMDGESHTLTAKGEPSMITIDGSTLRFNLDDFHISSNTEEF